MFYPWTRGWRYRVNALTSTDSTGKFKAIFILDRNKNLTDTHTAQHKTNNYYFAWFLRTQHTQLAFAHFFLPITTGKICQHTWHRSIHEVKPSHALLSPSQRSTLPWAHAEVCNPGRCPRQLHTPRVAMLPLRHSAISESRGWSLC